MDKLNSIIGDNLAYIREEMNLSLDDVSYKTGVSKGLLAQIERGGSNPTVNTLWKIANGLGISFTALIEQQENTVAVISRDEIEPIKGSDDKYRAYLLFPYSQKKKFEIFTVELDPGCSHKSEAHSRGVEEYITVTTGTLELVLGEKTYKVHEGDALSFTANKPHIYQNNSSSLTQIQVINFYAY